MKMIFYQKNNTGQLRWEETQGSESPRSGELAVSDLPLDSLKGFDAIAAVLEADPEALAAFELYTKSVQTRTFVSVMGTCSSQD